VIVLLLYCCTGVATLKVLEEEKIVEHCERMGHVLRRHLEELKTKHVSVGDVRSIGLFGKQ
jgi:4-aminobutyrate aminotransferase-like enzyme